ncbi:unnamed protein product [Effrenium voratum]|uniref:Cyclic nucleotide-binding domain-containing protein n=1 Tax=Effrenium voratum TaxID=2562239 RepID=A0AA36J2X5_9DINO|nr:unnamed protein product [Effrenium voratum]
MARSPLGKQTPLRLEELRLTEDEELLRRASVSLASLSCECLLELLRGNNGAHVKDVDFEGTVELEAESLTVLLRGSYAQEGREAQLRAPLALNEAAFLGVAELPPAGAARASCSAWARAKVISQQDFQSVLQKFPEEAKVFDRFSREATFFAVPGVPFCRVQEAAGKRLLAFLEAGREFQSCQRDFLVDLCSDAEGVLLAPGDLLSGDLHIVLAGRIQVESASGILLRFAGPGEVLGAPPADAEAAEAAEAAQPTADAGGGAAGGAECQGRAASASPAFCARLAPQRVAAALRRFPADAECWRRQAAALRREEARLLAQREEWAHQVAVPALGRTHLLAGCPEDFLLHVAGQLAEEAWDPDQEIVACNTAGDSMLVVLEGLVELRSKSGKEIGCLGPGGAFGEPEALGLLSYRTVTAKAVSACRLLAVSYEALTTALAAPSARVLKEGFKQLVQGRRKQVQQHSPLGQLLNLRGSLDEDTGAQLLSLRAERLPLELGTCWQPAADSDESGPRLSFVVRGRVALELETGGQPVDFHVKPGSVVPEGMLAANGAFLRAMSSDCEVFRVWHFDLQQAAFITPQAPDWFYQLRVLEQETRSWLHARLVSARGLLQNRAPHPATEQIRGWAEKKRESLRRARELQEQFAENYLGSKLPLLPPKKLGTTAFRSWGELPKPAKPAKAQGPGAEAFRALRLARSARSARSAPRLPPAWPKRGEAAAGERP